MAEENKYGGASITLYFTDARLLQRAQDLATICNVSTSKLIESLLFGSIEDMEKHAPTERIFNVRLTLKL